MVHFGSGRQGPDHYSVLKLLLLIILVICEYEPANGIRTKLTWVNGVGYNRDHMDEEALQISQLFGSAISYCHNPTAMTNEDDLAGYLGDLTQAGMHRLGRMTEEVTSLVKHLKTAVASVGKKGRVIHIAHSQGTLLTALAAKQLSPLEMSQIEVLAFGGAVVFRRTAQTPFCRCINYFALNDPNLFLVPSATQALRAGLVADDELCFLAPRVGDPLQDHQLLGQTYKQALRWEVQRFQKKYQSFTYRSIHLIATLSTSLVQDLVLTVARILLQVLERIKALLSPIFNMSFSSTASNLGNEVENVVVSGG